MNYYSSMRGRFGVESQGIYPIIVHLTLPIDDFSSDLHKVPAALELITKFVNKHDFNNLDAVIMACNTAHLLASDIIERTNIPLNSLVKNTIDHITQLKIKRVGIVASQTTIENNIFAFNNVSVIIPTDTQLNQLKQMIKGIIAGVPPINFENDLMIILGTLIDRGAEAVILGCTEFELIMSGSIKTNLIRPLDLTAKSIFKLR